MLDVERCTEALKGLLCTFVARCMYQLQHRREQRGGGRHKHAVGVDDQAIRRAPRCPQGAIHDLSAFGGKLWCIIYLLLELSIQCKGRCREGMDRGHVPIATRQGVGHDIEFARLVLDLEVISKELANPLVLRNG